MMKSMMLMAVAALMAAPAVAGTPAIRAVSFADLNLQTPEGVSTLERRIARAANSICAVNPAAQSVALDDARAQCITETVAATRASVDAAVRAQRSDMMLTAGTH